MLSSIGKASSIICLRMLHLLLLFVNTSLADAFLASNGSSISAFTSNLTSPTGNVVFLRHGNQLARSLPTNPILQHPLVTAASLSSLPSSVSTSNNNNLYINNNKQNVLQLVKNIEERLKQMRRTEMQVTTIQVQFLILLINQ